MLQNIGSPTTMLHRRLPVWVMSCLAVLTMACSAGAAELTQRLQFDIAPQSLSTALVRFSEQAKLQFNAPGSLNEIRSGGVHGEHTAAAALDLLLRDTGLEYRVVDEGTVAIRAKDAAAKIGSTDEEAVRTGQLASAAMPSPHQGEGGGEDQKGSRGASASSEAEKSKVQEIVVTAQKREEKLQDVPISLSVMSGARLDRSSAQGLTELLNTVPGVAAFQYTSQTGGTNVAIRGVSAGNPVNNGSSPISYYLDSVPFGFVRTAIGPEANAYDLDRVEVLRGPQGTLYGASALNGVVRVLSRDADLNKFGLKSRASLSSTEGGGGNYRGDLAVNLPIVEGKLGARAVASYQNLSGWISRPSSNNANDAELRTVRLKLNAQPVDQLSLGASLWSSRQDYGAPSFGGSDHRAISPMNEPMSTDYDVLSGKIVYEFPGISLAATTGHLKFKARSMIDFSQTPGGAAVPYAYDVQSEVLSQEINLSSKSDGPWRWTAGGIYRDGQDNTSAIIPSFLVRIISELGSESYAFFGETTRSFEDGKFALTAGLRYFHDEVYFDNLVSSQHVEDAFSATTPRVVATWHPSENLTAYASYAQGFRSGAPQSVGSVPPEFPAVKPDKLKNYELGAKGSLLDGRFSFDAAVYYVTWDDVQLSLTVPFGTLNVPINALVNASSVGGPGVDFGVTVRPSHGLTLGANIGWNDLTVDENVISAGAVLFSKDERLNFSPEVTASGTLDCVFPLGGQGYEGEFSTSLNYTSEQDHRTIVLGVRSLASGDALLTGRMSFSLRAPGGLITTLFADNVTDEDGTIYGQPFKGVRAPYLDGRMRPRTVGLQLEYQY